MKSITRFLLAVLSFAPGAYAAPVAQTAGSNLTQYNGAAGSVAGNQWNSMTNPRINAQSSGAAKADYGNCGTVILRCAKPKCAGGGCANMDVAKTIAAGCVNSNSVCKKQGEELVDFVAGQLVAESVAKQNQQAANVATSNAAAEQNAQIMQQQMQQMQQQMQMMQEQNNSQIASLQNALAESQQATADAVAAAAQSAAANVVSSSSTVVDAGTGLNAVQSAAARSGVSEEIIARATISGEILTAMQGVDESLDNLKTVMRDAFRYAGCNEINGDNCEGPHRVRKFRELANKFFDPYDALERNLETALNRAESVGIDLGNIYMYFSGSCNRWAEYICRNYNENSKYTTDNCSNGISQNKGGARGNHECVKDMLIPPEDFVGCTLNKYLDPSVDDIADMVLNADMGDNASSHVGCARDIGQNLFRHRRSSNGGKSGVDIDLLQMLIAQSEGSLKFDNKKCTNASKAECRCGLGLNNDSIDAAITTLETAVSSKALGQATEGQGKCCKSAPGTANENCTSSCYDTSVDVSYVDPVFALCDTHVWNAGYKDNDEIKEEDEAKLNVQRIIGLKTTVITQQMYKQYTTLEKVIKQVKIMLEKEVLKANLKVAGGTSDDSSDTNVSFENCRGKDDEETVLSCLRRNFAKYGEFVNKGNRRTDVVKAMNEDMKALVAHCIECKSTNDFESTRCSKEITNKSAMQGCYNELEKGIVFLNRQIKNDNRNSGMGGFMMVPVGSPLR